MDYFFPAIDHKGRAYLVAAEDQDEQISLLRLEYTEVDLFQELGRIEDYWCCEKTPNIQDHHGYQL